MAHIACPWDEHVLSLSRMAERRSQERRQPIVIYRRDNDTLRIALTSGNMCVHGPRAPLHAHVPWPLGQGALKV